jgi:predicted kinase
VSDRLPPDLPIVRRAYAALALSPPASGARRPVLVILSGLPGTGKTHLARTICGRAPFTLVGSDPLRAILVDPPRYTPLENHAVYRLADALLRRLFAERRDVIYDAVNLSVYRRAALRRLAEDSGARAVTVLTSAPPHLVWLRLAHRSESQSLPGDSHADWEVYKKLASKMTPVRHPYLVVDTSRDEDVDHAVDRILRLIRAAPSGE